jgi:hypothetical protein
MPHRPNGSVTLNYSPKVGRNLEKQKREMFATMAQQLLGLFVLSAWVPSASNRRQEGMPRGARCDDPASLRAALQIATCTPEPDLQSTRKVHNQLSESGIERKKNGTKPKQKRLRVDSWLSL